MVQRVTFKNGQMVRCHTDGESFALPGALGRIAKVHHSGSERYIGVTLGGYSVDGADRRGASLSFNTNPEVSSEPASWWVNKHAFTIEPKDPSWYS